MFFECSRKLGCIGGDNYVRVRIAREMDNVRVLPHVLLSRKQKEPNRRGDALFSSSYVLNWQGVQVLYCKFVYLVCLN